MLSYRVTLDVPFQLVLFVSLCVPRIPSMALTSRVAVPAV